MHLRKLVAPLVAAALLAACNINVKAPVPEGDPAGAIATVVAQTLEAAVITPFASPIAPPSGATPGTTSSPIASPSATVTTTPSGDKAMLSITGNSNCRRGPAISFKNVTSFTPGAELEIVARNTENNYWQVKIPNTQETCWVWGQYATTKGNVESIPESTAVVDSAVASVPSQPGALFYQYQCTAYSITVSLTWSDHADNESGYHLYRAGTLIADLPANSSKYEDTVASAPPMALQYSVAAYNDSGESPTARQSFTACP